ncbi:MFS transporter [Myceligenerans halotolerans]
MSETRVEPPAPRATEPPQQRRTLAVLVAAQILSGAGLAAGITVGALLAQDMLGSTSLSGLPSALFTIGSAGAALMIGRITQRLGRRPGLALGYLGGAIGSAGVIAAAALDNAVLLFAALFVYGAGTATNLQARYAGADLAAPARRGRAVSTVLVATTLGAVAGPNLVTVMGSIAESLGIPALAGPFLLSGAAYGAASLVLWVWLRPDPLLVARELAASESVTRELAAREAAAREAAAREAAAGPSAALAVGSSSARADVGNVLTPISSNAAGTVLLAGTIMVLTQAVMVAVMTMTPVHMQAHHHSVGAIGMVIAAHVGMMYLPSPLSGWLVDRHGPMRVAVAAAGVLLLSGVVAAAAPTGSLVLLAVALGLLGLGWSFGLVAGTAMLTAAVPIESRAKTQGAVDLTVALAGAAGGMGSGIVVAGTSYAMLALGGGFFALLILPAIALTVRRSGARTTPPAA